MIGGIDVQKLDARESDGAERRFANRGRAIIQRNQVGSRRGAGEIDHVAARWFASLGNQVGKRVVTRDVENVITSEPDKMQLADAREIGVRRPQRSAESCRPKDANGRSRSEEIE